MAHFGEEDVVLWDSCAMSDSRFVRRLSACGVSPQGSRNRGKPAIRSGISTMAALSGDYFTVSCGTKRNVFFVPGI